MGAEAAAPAPESKSVQMLNVNRDGGDEDDGVAVCLVLKVDLLFICIFDYLIIYSLAWLDCRDVPSHYTDEEPNRNRHALTD